MPSRECKGEGIPIRHRVLPVSQPKDKSPSSSHSTWEFVNISQLDRGNNAELRRSVRANAMRHFHSEQRARKRKLEHHAELCKRSTCLEHSSLAPKESDALPTKPHSGCQSVQPLEVSVTVTQDAKSGYDGGNSGDGKTLLYPCSPPALDHPTPSDSPYTPLGNGGSDPFNSLPVHRNHLDPHIFHHCKLPPHVKPH